MNIYVGNLSYDLTEEDIQNAFAAFGEVVSVKIIKDQYSGRSKGFGFVEMSDKDQADAAINDLNGKELKGRALKVNISTPRADSNKGGGRERRGGGGGGGDRFNRGGGNRRSY